MKNTTQAIAFGGGLRDRSSIWADGAIVHRAIVFERSGEKAIATVQMRLALCNIAMTAWYDREEIAPLDQIVCCG